MNLDHRHDYDIDNDGHHLHLCDDQQQLQQQQQRRHEEHDQDQSQHHQQRQDVNRTPTQIEEPPSSAEEASSYTAAAVSDATSSPPCLPYYSKDRRRISATTGGGDSADDVTIGAPDGNIISDAGVTVGNISARSSATPGASRRKPGRALLLLVASSLATLLVSITWYALRNGWSPTTTAAAGGVVGLRKNPGDHGISEKDEQRGNSGEEGGPPSLSLLVRD